MTRKKDDKMQIGRNRLDDYDAKVEARWTKQARAKQDRGSKMPGKTDSTHRTDGGKQDR